MPRALTPYLMLLALAVSPVSVQPATEDLDAKPQVRRPAGRRLLDEAASERKRGRAALAEREPDLLPVAPYSRSSEPAVRDTAPAEASPKPPAENFDRSASYPFDAPLPAPTRDDTENDRYAAMPPKVPASAGQASAVRTADARYSSSPQAAPPAGAPAEIAQAEYEVKPAEVQTMVYTEPAQPADGLPPAEAATVSSPAEMPAVLQPEVEAVALPVEQATAGPGLPLAPRDEAEAAAETDGQGKPAPCFGDAKSPLTTMVGSLGLVLALFFALVWVMRRAAPASLRQMPMDVVEVLGRAPLPGKQQQMHLVRCGRKLLLLASSPNGFTTLTEITEAHEVDRLVGLCRGELPRVGAATFQQSGSESLHDSFGRGYGEESIDSAAAALARRLSRSSRLGEAMIDHTRALGATAGLSGNALLDPLRMHNPGTKISLRGKPAVAPTTHWLLVVIILLLGAFCFVGRAQADDVANSPARIEAPIAQAPAPATPAEATPARPSDAATQPLTDSVYTAAEMALQGPEAVFADPPDWLAPDKFGSSLQMMLLMTVLSLVPAVLVMTTSFIRIIVVLGLLRQALGTQQSPPSQVITSIALFLTLLIMTPVWKQVYDEAVVPYTAKELTLEQAWTKGVQPVRRFMSLQIARTKNYEDVWLFVDYLPDKPNPSNFDEVPLQALLPAFVLSELKTAFLIGFKIYLPFLVLDMVIASVMVSMGMLMVPPAMVALPFKLLLFVLVDGWHLVIGMLLESFAPFT